LIEIGLEGVKRLSWSSLGGVDALDEDTSIMVGVEVDSEGLRDAILLVSEPAALWFDMGNAFACST
jgi:hypothetical protein